ncbi:MAG: diguanylate cyclase, partial [Desulfobulbaceae bacterium]|nr:diguanylate cyclase [Desulfobulbaceae bacterium]
NVALYGASPDHDTLMVSDHNGRIIASSSYRDIGKPWRESSAQNKINQGIINQIIQEQRIEIRLSEDKKWIEGYASICREKSPETLRDKLCGFLYYRQNLSYHEKRAFAEMRNMGLLTGVGILLSSFFLWYLLHIRLFKQTSVLMGVLEKYRKGEKLIRTGMASKDEIGLIAASVDSLLDIISEDEKRLSDSERRFRTLMGNIPGAVFRCRIDEPWTILFISEGIREITGHGAEALHGEKGFNFFDLVFPEDRGMVKKIISQWIGSRQSFTLEYRVVNTEGNIRWVSMRGRCENDSSAFPSFFDAVLIDITVNKIAEQKLRDSEEMLAAMSQAANDAITIIDSRDNIIFWNKAAERLFGYRADEVIGRQKFHAILTLSEDREKAYRGMVEFAKSGTGPVLDSVSELVAIKKSGEVFPVERAVAAFQMDGSWYAVGSIRDITERKKNEEELRKLATIDSLTGLYNRRYFLELAENQLNQARRYSLSFCVCMFDIDHFKRVNDTHGHDVGDIVLREIAELCCSVVRETDVVGRLGGEEFAVTMLHTALPEAMQAVERLRSRVEGSGISTDKGEIHVTISAGVAQLTGVAQSIGDLLKIADEGLYEAKNSGRNKVLVGGVTQL